MLAVAVVPLLEIPLTCFDLDVIASQEAAVLFAVKIEVSSL